MHPILIKTYRDAKKAKQKADRKAKRVKRQYLPPIAKSIIQRIYMKPWTESQLAEAFDVSECRIRQILKETFDS